jgi:hypothetical protein
MLVIIELVFLFILAFVGIEFAFDFSQDDVLFFEWVIVDYFLNPYFVVCFFVKRRIIRVLFDGSIYEFYSFHELSMKNIAEILRCAQGARSC